MTVCLGNICRSPAAESVLVHKLREAGLDDVTVSSAGTADYHIGKRPHELSIAEGQSRGYDFTSVAAQFTADHFEEADLILVMDGSNADNVRALAPRPEDEAKVVRLGAFAPDAADGVRDVADPWGHPRPAYVQMYEQVEEAIDGLVAAIADGRLTPMMEEFGAVGGQSTDCRQ